MTNKSEEDRIKEALSYSMGADLHEAWRETRLQEDGTYEPSMKKSKDEKWNEEHETDDVDIANLSFEELPSNWQYENLEAARVVINQVFDKIMESLEITPENIEDMSSVVHDEWLKRNEWVYDEENGNPNLTVPYLELPEEEKDKDRMQIQEAIEKVQSYNKGEVDIEELVKKYDIERKIKENKRAKLIENIKKLAEEKKELEEKIADKDEQIKADKGIVKERKNNEEIEEDEEEKEDDNSNYIEMQ